MNPPLSSSLFYLPYHRALLCWQKLLLRSQYSWFPFWMFTPSDFTPPSSLCLPIMLYGCELWSPTKSELLMLERVHRRILRTIQGLPLRCNSLALQCLMETVSITSLIHQRQLNFVLSFRSLPLDSPHRLIFQALICHPPSKGFIPTLLSTLSHYDLPSPSSIIDMTCSKPA